MDSASKTVSKCVHFYRVNGSRRYGYLREPIFGTRFNFQDARPDLFHFEYRVNDVFMRHILGLINEQYDLDDKDEVGQLLLNLHDLSERQKSNIKFELKYGNITVKGRVTNDMERKFFNQLPLGEILFNQPEQTFDIIHLMNAFYEIINLYRHRQSNLTYVPQLKSKSLSWVQNFSKIFGSPYITPYMHIFTDHMPGDSLTTKILV
ncbi:unnamed protein product [Didymodactylos carnosus]|uniref:Uncharacterized protein n=1 Tax=Didymodactylos carnosus TaxID=1234261 RepID=A0A8S2W4D5_9BILA|nr:unnamed protein product [Didymodactylos carnosus]